jgi:hypothetical protein
VASLLVESAIASVETQLGQASRRARIFCYINFDDYVHDHGYDETMAEALLRLERGVRRWTERGVDVVAISDHGVVPCDVTPERVTAFERLGDEPLSRLGIGGAGRVRWLYPHPRQEDRLIAMCEDLIGRDGVVLTAEALQASGFFPGDAVASGIGEIVVLVH